MKHDQPCDHDVTRWEDPERAPKIEFSEMDSVIPLQFLQKKVGNQIARDDKEDLHTEVSEFIQEICGRRLEKTASTKQMTENHEQNKGSFAAMIDNPACTSAQ